MPVLKVNKSETEAELLLFDVDGTLVDDVDRYHNLAKIRFSLIEKYAGEASARTWANYEGVDPGTMRVDMKGPISKATRNEDIAIAAASLYNNGYTYYAARGLIRSIYVEADKTQAQKYSPRFIEGVEEGLRRLKKDGFRMGIATNGQSEITRELLASLGASNLFEVIVGADMVNQPKPSPDMILEACRLMNVTPNQAVYIGDQETDLLAGLGAQVKMVIGVGDDVKDLEADLHIRSVASFSFK